MHINMVNFLRFLFYFSFKNWIWLFPVDTHTWGFGIHAQVFSIQISWAGNAKITFWQHHYPVYCPCPHFSLLIPRFSMMCPFLPAASSSGWISIKPKC